MKVVGFNGSARKDGNTAILIKYVFEELNKEGIDTELVQFAGKKVAGCTACRKCFELKDKQCAVKDDIINECIEKCLGQRIILIPIYFADITPPIKSLIDRAGYVAKATMTCSGGRSGLR